MTKEIKICNCGAPLLWTFLYNGAEYFCLNCGYMAGMLGAGENVEATTELKADRKVVEKVFKALRPFLIGDGCFQRTNCKKCKETGEYHPQHLTKRQEAENKIAEKILAHLNGYYKN
jgi:hypothetical protein